MIKYCLGYIDGDTFVYLTENKEGIGMTEDFNGALIFNEKGREAFPTSPIMGMLWLPVFFGESDIG